MKKKLFSLTVALTIVIAQNLSAQTGTWAALKNQSPDPNDCTMLLLTDGTVIINSSNGTGYGTVWDKLTPDSTGSYLNGTWTQIAQMNYDRFSFPSQVLPSGKVWVSGGEYGAGGGYGEVYDPVANTWTVCGNIPTNWNIYDAPSELLYTGNVLVGPEIGTNAGQPCTNVMQWNPGSLAFTVEANEPENHDEAPWIKLPDSTVLATGMPTPNANPSKDSSCRFQPQTNTWMVDAMTPNNLFDQWGYEAGGGYLLPNGKAVFFGATQYNAIYTPSGNSKTKGSWAAAATAIKIGGNYVNQPDAPGAMMVNGHILMAVSPIPTASNEFNTPTYFEEYNYTTNTFTQVTATIPTIGSNSLAGCISQNVGFLDLPDGTVLMCSNSTSNPNQLFIYTPGSGPIAQGKPVIDGVTTTNCISFQITGKLFNGISEGTGYGDDVQNVTNYPIVRLSKGGKVWYAKTTNWNRIGAVMTDSLPDTAYFTLPAGMPNGTYSLVLSANGFSSSPTTFTLPCSPTGVEQVSTTNNAVKAYPNPSKGIFTIEAELPMPNSVLEVDNMMGQQILREQVNLTKNDIDLSGQPEGIYFYRLLNNEGNLIGAGKLVVQK
jgi:hypothetical protein